MGPAALLDAGLGELGLDLPGEPRERLLAYLDLLARWNRAYNLTAVRDPREMVPRHLLDSLAVLPYIDPGPLLDVGTGPGLPGLPLALARPGLAVTLLDSNGKKARFCTQAVAELGLSGVQVVHARVEAYRPGAPFPQVITRAFTSLAGFRRAAAHLVAPGGRLLALKGRYPGAELDELAAAGGGAAAVHPLAVPGLQGERHLVIIPGDAGGGGPAAPAMA